MPQELLQIEDLGGPHEGYRVLCRGGHLSSPTSFSFRLRCGLTPPAFLS
jgi:hypothetical protein